MAYLAFDEITGGDVAANPVPAADARSAVTPVQPGASLSALEWSVAALAERDRIATLRTPSRIAVALGTLFGERYNPQLADPRLEALRRMAVLSWHHGYTVAGEAVREFLEAGFTPDQYELLVDSIGAARAQRSRRTVQ